ncbi:tetratricopeptide repeat protein [bacterium]|nr:tetratricopeptide repeat protein [bacterium]
MQRKVSITIFAVILSMAANIFAQEKTSKLLPDEVGGSFIATRQDQTTRNAPGPGAGPGFSLYAKYNLNPRMFFTVGAGYVSATDNIMRFDKEKVSLFPMAELRFGYNIMSGKFSPYVNAGIMGFKSVYTDKLANTTTNMRYDPAFTGGLGMSYKLNKQLSLNAGGDIAYAFMSTTSGNVGKPIFWMAKAGVSYALGKSTKKAKGEEIEYPVDNNELAIDDLFKMNSDDNTSGKKKSTVKSGNKSEDDALALLFGESEQSGSDVNAGTSTTKSADNYNSSAETSNYSRPRNANELIARVEQLQAEIDRNRREVDNLKSKVSENERTLAQVSGKVAGQYAGIEQSSAGRVSDNSFKSNYKQALQYFYNRNYKETIRMMRSLLSSNPDNRLASNCQYWIGESLNAMGDYRSAVQAFNSVLSYRKSYKFDDALLMAGLCSLKLGDKSTARERFQKLVSKYPDSEYAPKAMRYLGRL